MEGVYILRGSLSKYSSAAGLKVDCYSLFSVFVVYIVFNWGLECITEKAFQKTKIPINTEVTFVIMNPATALSGT
jgi:hypothetical protein